MNTEKIILLKRYQKIARGLFMAINSIYSVKGLNVSKLNKLETKVYEFITSSEFMATVKNGDSLSEKKLKNQFSAWNKEKLTVNVNSIVNEKTCRKVCLFIVSMIKSGLLKSSVIPCVHINKTHGNFSIDFICVNKINENYTEKELTEKQKKIVTVFDFLTNYLSKESTITEIENTENRNDKIDAIVSILETLKD